ncbi:MAG: YbjN domain-containing protein [Anaerolineaceae bacterium]|nr:YbjN domain-containing protein [Anaerolineaceae bacterium]
MDINGNAQPMMDVVLRFFQEEQWNYQKLEGKPVIRAGFRGVHGTWVCFARVEEEKKQFLFHSLLGMNIPPQYRALVVEYITRVNYCLTVGNFEMDYDSGDIRFRTSVETPDGELSVAIVRCLAYTNVHTIDHYFPGVLAVMHGGLSPEAALARIEAQLVGSAANLAQF